jgi:hypothetical protein
LGVGFYRLDFGKGTVGNVDTETFRWHCPRDYYNDGVSKMLPLWHLRVYFIKRVLMKWGARLFWRLDFTKVLLLPLIVYFDRSFCICLDVGSHSILLIIYNDASLPESIPQLLVFVSTQVVIPYCHRWLVMLLCQEVSCKMLNMRMVFWGLLLTLFIGWFRRWIVLCRLQSVIVPNTML